MTETTAEIWADRIIATCHKTVEAIVETGRLLIAAKAALPRGEFSRLIAGGLVPFGRRTADRLISIANNPVLATATTLSRSLPASWSVLYELSQWPQPALVSALETGVVTPITSYRGARRLRVLQQQKPRREPVQASTRASRAARLLQIRQLAAEGASVRQIAAAVRLGEERVRAIITTEHIEVPADKIVRGSRRLSSPRIFEQTIMDAENVVADVRLIVFEDLDPVLLRSGLLRLRTARRALTRFMLLLHDYERSLYVRDPGDESHQRRDCHAADPSPVEGLSGGAGTDAHPAATGDPARIRAGARR